MTDVIVPEYTSGPWVAVVTDGGIALLPAGTDERTVRRLWTSMRGDATGAALVRHLEELVRDGLTSLPPFALVSVAAGQVHAVVRGQVEVHVVAADGARVITAPHVATWSEQVVDDVVSVTVRAPGAPPVGDRASYPLLSGVAHVGAVTVVLRATTSGTADEAPVDPPSGARPTGATHRVAAPAADPVPEVGAIGVAPSQVPSPAVPALVPVDDPSDHTLLRPARTAAGPAGGRDTEPTSAHVRRTEVGLTDLPSTRGADTGTPVRETPVRETPVAETPVAADAADVPGTPVAPSGHSTDHDGTTVLSADVVALRRLLPDWAGHAVLALGAPPADRAPTPSRPTPTRLAMSTGERVPLNRPVLVGRAPQATRVHSTQVPRLLTVPSPLQDISRTHAEVRMDGDDVVLTDLHSTNGVLVVRCDAGPQRLQPGEPTVLQPGVLVDLGEGITFTVERGA